MTERIDVLTGQTHPRYKAAINQPDHACPVCGHGHGGATKSQCAYCECVNRAMDQRRRRSA